MLPLVRIAKEVRPIILLRRRSSEREGGDEMRWSVEQRYDQIIRVRMLQMNRDKQSL